MKRHFRWRAHMRMKLFVYKGATWTKMTSVCVLVHEVEPSNNHLLSRESCAALLQWSSYFGIGNTSDKGLNLHSSVAYTEPVKYLCELKPYGSAQMETLFIKSTARCCKRFKVSTLYHVADRNESTAPTETNVICLEANSFSKVRLYSDIFFWCEECTHFGKSCGCNCIIDYSTSTGRFYYDHKKMADEHCNETN